MIQSLISSRESWRFAKPAGNLDFMARNFVDLSFQSFPLRKSCEDLLIVCVRGSRARRR